MQPYRPLPTSHESPRLKLAWLVGGLTVLAAVLGTSLFGIESWQRTREDIASQLRIQAEFVANSANTLLTSLRVGLPNLAEQLNVATSQPTSADYIALAGYLRSHPYIANLILYGPTGRMLLNTAAPFGTPLPNISPRTREEVRQALRGNGLQLGRTQRGLIYHGWHLTVLYALHSSTGQPIALLQANLPVDLLTGQWASMSLLPETGLGLLRTDGYVLARLPEPGSMTTLYGRRYRGSLVEAVMRHPERLEGPYSGRVEVDGRDRIGAYARLAQIPAVAFVSLPLSRVWSLWWHHLLPILGVGLVSLIGFMALIARLFSRERQHALSLAAERDRHVWIARHDPLTQLPNRVALAEHLTLALARARRRERLLAVGLFDLDDFKDVNDRYGHAGGDRLLRALGDVLRQSMRETDYIVRLGGDEFVLLFEDLEDIDDLMTALERLQQELAEPILIEAGERIVVAASLGLSIYPFDDAEADTLLRHADQALYHSKKHKNTRQHFWALYEHDGEQSKRHLHTRRRLEAGELHVYYQPILDLQTRQIVGVEALARLIDRQTGVISEPAQFLPDLDTSEDQYHLVRQVLRQVDTDVQVWDRAGLSELSVSVNLPPSLLMRGPWLDRLLSTIGEMRLPPHRLILEVLETEGDIPLENTIDSMLALKSRGIRFALDDIGSAYSTLLRLKDLPVDSVKLDQGFVRELCSHPEDLIFIEALMGIAEVLEIDFIAEGVETLSILDALQGLHVPKAQGYAIARPMPGNQFLEWYHHYQPPIEGPNTLLGLYAAHRQRDYFFHHLLTQNPGFLQSSSEESLLGQVIVPGLLERLGHAGSELDVAHHRYHDVLLTILAKEGVSAEKILEFERASATLDALLEDVIRKNALACQA
ncbi:putative bifunctional diguanylate cyclase/phosphodiesterase [Acidihalobacter yilgarnensis]|uniref:putative bifunctional diguanylate cyclase/phosphodiesterase n=1 Tax=Acidihalobacter yilgarnensis TaxID=2819280 RepID=UPI000ABB0EBF|nr:EAL domain-containing protein [Acidihalobacter yilgarnensis]